MRLWHSRSPGVRRTIFSHGCRCGRSLIGEPGQGALLKRERDEAFPMELQKQAPADRVLRDSARLSPVPAINILDSRCAYAKQEIDNLIRD